MAEEKTEPVADVPKTLEGIARMLQAEPVRFMLFGCYWWAVKRMLKEHGFTRDNLCLLGPYTDPEAEGHLPAEPDSYLLALAIEEQQRNAFHNWGSADVYFPDDGDPYHLFDSDIAFQS